MSPFSIFLDRQLIPANRTCAIVGGVLTVASILDSALFATQRSFKKGAGDGHANGKLM
jgi:hypothetical protein